MAKQEDFFNCTLLPLLLNSAPSLRISISELFAMTQGFGVYMLLYLVGSLAATLAIDRIHKDL